MYWFLYYMLLSAVIVGYLLRESDANEPRWACYLGYFLLSWLALPGVCLFVGFQMLLPNKTVTCKGTCGICNKSIVHELPKSTYRRRSKMSFICPDHEPLEIARAIRDAEEEGKHIGSMVKVDPRELESPSEENENP